MDSDVVSGGAFTCRN